MSFDTNIVRYANLNVCNDTLPGGGGGNIGPQIGLAPGQLGKRFFRADSELVYDSSVGTVYGGWFRYVQLSSGSSTPVIGQIVFWDYSLAVSVANDELYRVTTLETTAADANAITRAGIVLSSGVTAGNYTIIQDWGPTFVKFRTTLTDTGAIGSPCYCAGAGAGVDNGFADVLNDPNPVGVADVALMQRRYLGTARVAPSSLSLTLVDLAFGATQRG